MTVVALLAQDPEQAEPTILQRRRPGEGGGEATTAAPSTAAVEVVEAVRLTPAQVVSGERGRILSRAPTPLLRRRVEAHQQRRRRQQQQLKRRRPPNR